MVLTKEQQYEKSIKHMKRITHGQNKNIIYPVCKGVYHYNNTISATDRHRLLYVKIDGAAFDEQILDVKNGETIDGDFLDVESRFIKDDDIEIDLYLINNDIKTLKSTLSCMKSANHKKIKLTVNNGYWVVKPYVDSDSLYDENLNISYTIAKATDSFNKDRVFNINYFIQAIDFIKETKADARLLMTDNSLAPIEFTDVGRNSGENDFKYKYIFCPIRTT